MEEINKIKIKLKTICFILLFIIVFCLLVLFIMNRFIVEKEYYKNADFNIKNIYSKVDFNNNNIDDYGDILLGARKEINKDNTNDELIIKAFKYAGYDLEEMAEGNIKEFIINYGTKVSKDILDIEYFQAGDLIIYGNNIAIVSDRRNKDGIAFLIYVILIFAFPHLIMLFFSPSKNM